MWKLCFYSNVFIAWCLPENYRPRMQNMYDGCWLAILGPNYLLS